MPSAALALIAAQRQDETKDWTTFTAARRATRPHERTMFPAPAAHGKSHAMRHKEAADMRMQAGACADQLGCVGA